MIERYVKLFERKTICATSALRYLVDEPIVEAASKIETMQDIADIHTSLGDSFDYHILKNVTVDDIKTSLKPGKLKPIADYLYIQTENHVLLVDYKGKVIIDTEPKKGKDKRIVELIGKVKISSRKIPKVVTWSIC